MKYFKYYTQHLTILSLLLIASQCATVPVTGRKQLSTVSNSELIPMSFAQYKEVLKTSKLSNDAEQVAMVKRVGERVQKAVEIYARENGYTSVLNGFQWEFNLLDDDKTVNAWCMPGGKVAFYTGIMPICKDETGVAVVMGHEIAHAVASHGRERMSQAMVAQLGLSSLQIAMGSNPTATQELLMQSVGAGTQMGMLKFSRTHESEADKIGLIFMAMAGYDPAAAPKFWGRMSAGSGGSQPPEWQSTHPSHKTRIKDLNAQLPEAKKIYEKYKRTSSSSNKKKTKKKASVTFSR